MTAHPHAESMRLFAEDAASSNTPYYLWESKHVDDPSTLWRQMAGIPDWDPMWCYRRKPKPLDCWAVVNRNGVVCNTRESMADAEATLRGYGSYSDTMRIVHMREVTE